MMTRIAEFFDIAQWAAWFSSREREFIFLLVLPFVVALVALWAHFTDRERS